MVPAIDFIGRFINISENEMADMLRIIHTASFNKNEVILKQGEVGRMAAFVVKGCVRSFYKDEAGEEFTAGFVFENHPLTPMDFFSNPTPSPLSVIALEPTELITVSRNDFFDFLEKYPRYEAALRKMISEYMVLQGERFRLLRIPAARDRYEALVQMQPEIIQRVPLKYVANYLGIALETLSRIRSAKA